MFEFKRDYVLENAAVRLSPLKLEHILKLERISNEKNLWRYFLEKGNGIENLTKYIHHTIDNRTKEIEYPFVIYDKLKKQYAGTTRFYEFSEELKTIKLGHTWIGERFRATGLNKNFKYLLLEFAFEKLKVERVGFGAHSDNKISIAAMKSIGCVEEGVLRSFIPRHDNKTRADIVLMSMLKSEWFDKAKSELKVKLNTKQ